MENCEKNQILIKIYMANLLDIISGKLKMEIMEFKENKEHEQDSKEKYLEHLEHLKSSLDNDLLYKTKMELSFFALTSSGKANAAELEHRLKELQDSLVDNLKNDITKLAHLINTMPISDEPIRGFEIEV